MALVLGTNCGFVTSAPVNDPTGTAQSADRYSFALKVTAPAGYTKITEVGWWCNGATEAANFEVGLYSHDAGNNKPNARLYVDNTNAKGTDAGWKTVAVDWDIVPETVYWIAHQIDDTATATTSDYGADAGERISSNGPDTTLAATWAGRSNQVDNYIISLYALVEVGATYSELSGTIAGQSAISGALDVASFTELSGTIAGVSALSGDLGSVLVSVANTNVYKRLIAVGNNQFWYEDI